MEITLRPYQVSRDEKDALELWKAAFGEQWPMTAEMFHNVTAAHRFYQEGDHWVAEMGGRLVGFGATGVARGLPIQLPAGGILVLMVHPDYRRRGVGARLHAAALDHLRRQEMRFAMLGGGGLHRFWPGVPDGLPEAAVFFKAMGWELEETVIDLVRSLEDYATPPAVTQRMAAEKVDIRPAAEEDIPAVLEFEEREFVFWMDQFQHKADIGDFSDFLVAWDAQKGVVGTLLMHTSRSKFFSANRVWKSLLGDQLGGLGAVGVAADERGRGIGIGLVAVASEVLKQRGVGNSHIDWTSIGPFYEKLGYHTWQEYKEAHRGLDE